MLSCSPSSRIAGSICASVMGLAVLVVPAANAQESACDPPPNTITIQLPKLGLPPDEEGQGWVRPQVWEHHPDSTDDSITIPNGRPIYALIVSGYANNAYLDEMMVYNFTRFLQSKGAYVHYAWWNNLLAPYMARPLHHSQSTPGSLTKNALNFTSAKKAGKKAVPAEDYQFVADAKLMLSAIREHNPGAMIIVVGHSMGGGAVVHLGSQTDVLIDILAPIDPVNNRNYPWAGLAEADAKNHPDYNWTRWRVTRDNFLGYTKLVKDGLQCVPEGPWIRDRTETGSDLFCKAVSNAHAAPQLVFGSNIINLHHRWQNEYLFPFDYKKNYEFGHDQPTNGTTSQKSVAMKKAFNGLVRVKDEGGWPALGDPNAACCTDGDNGVGWGQDGHGEIVGYRGPGNPIPLGVRLRTSPQCGAKCDNLTWPARKLSVLGKWSKGDSKSRVKFLKSLETKPESYKWKHRPISRNMCRVSSGLIKKFKNMNKPPAADADGDQVVECVSSNCGGPGETPVILNGLASSDPDDDALEYNWTWSTGSSTDPVTIALFPNGVHCVTLEVRDPSGHIDRESITVTVQDSAPPLLTVNLCPRLLWPPNHQMKTIEAEVEAQDLCGEVTCLTLVSIVSNQPDYSNECNGDIPNDIQNATFGTPDLKFKLRAERDPLLGDRYYTVTYQATDDSGNQALVSVDVIVPRDEESLEDWEELLDQ